MKLLNMVITSANKNINSIPFGRCLTYAVTASLICHGFLVITYNYLNSTRTQDKSLQSKT